METRALDDFVFVHMVYKLCHLLSFIVLNKLKHWWFLKKEMIIVCFQYTQLHRRVVHFVMFSQWRDYSQFND